ILCFAPVLEQVLTAPINAPAVLRIKLPQRCPSVEVLTSLDNLQPCLARLSHPPPSERPGRGQRGPGLSSDFQFIGASTRLEKTHRSFRTRSSARDRSSQGGIGC